MSPADELVTAGLGYVRSGLAAPGPGRQVNALLASPRGYPNMPADRLWEMKDAKVNLGVVEPEP